MKPSLLILLALLLAACRQSAQQAQQDIPVAIRVYSQYTQGDTLELVRIKLSLDQYEVRYRAGLPPGQLGAIYFLPDGDLHIDAEKVGDTWVLLNSPMLELSGKSPQERVADWDTAADSQNNPHKQ